MEELPWLFFGIGTRIGAIWSAVACAGSVSAIGNIARRRGLSDGGGFGRWKKAARAHELRQLSCAVCGGEHVTARFDPEADSVSAQQERICRIVGLTCILIGRPTAGQPVSSEATVP